MMGMCRFYTIRPRSGKIGVKKAFMNQLSLFFFILNLMLTQSFCTGKLGVKSMQFLCSDMFFLPLFLLSVVHCGLVL